MIPEVSLFSPLKRGVLQLKNRFVMAPMTRSRADDEGVPADISVTYYTQRATAGLIISEGTAPEPLGKGYTRIPGIYSAPQVAAWRKITQSVHAHDSKIFLQLMHTGRIAHPDNLNGLTPIAPSAIKAEGQMFTKTGPKDHPVPREATEDDIMRLLNVYRTATENALEAGFDGVELHATSGYLPSQFLHSNSNLRTDAWGGSVEKRARFTLEALDAMISVVGGARVGIKIGPGFPFNDIHDADPKATYTYLVQALHGKNLAYLDLLDINAIPGWDVTGAIRGLFDGVLIANGGYTQEQAEDTLKNDRADAIAFGNLYLANPDLPERFQRHAPLNEPDKNTFYMGEEKGYTDYPTLEAA